MKQLGSAIFNQLLIQSGFSEHEEGVCSMKVLVLQGSPHKNGNTKQFSAPFIDELRKSGVTVQEEWIYDKKLKPCLGCGICQDRLGQLSCVQEDDFAQLVDQMLEADVTVFSTPIYACFPPGPVKIFLDRLIYAPIKLYGKEKAPSLLAGKACAVIITGGASPQRMIVPFETALLALTARYEMKYLGWTGGTDPGKAYVFMNEKKEQRARAFAHTVMDGANVL